MQRKTIITIGESDYEAELGTVDSTHLGREDHGIFAVGLNVRFGNSYQGVGPFGVDGYVDRLDRRVGSAAGAQIIIEILEAVGAPTWEELVGCDVFVLRSTNHGRIVGLAHATRDQHVVFEDMLKGFTPTGELVV